ncbi:STAS/SEC14 domain-containing protein [Sulfitobacter aestuarii]|uniref:STAS/SEC14 domain-containing protein n=1 Tax=Sulfitobacter aestuarii TaxID=2161676 RepID=A0ABW5U6K3_9RHOB
MFKIDEFAPRVLEIRFSDQMGEDEIEMLEAALAPYVSDEGAVNALLDLSDLSSAVWNGMFEAGLEQRLFDQAEKFGRVALVTRGEHFDDAAAALQKLLPRGEFRRFDRSDSQAAREFAAGMG